MNKLFSFAEKVLYDTTIEEEHFRKLRQKSSSGMAIIVGLVAAVGGFMYGYDTGLINDILEMEYVTSTFPGDRVAFTSHERALITAILSLGTFVGALAAPLISDNFGRKFSIILSAGLIFNVGNILQVLSSRVPLLCAGRAVSGVSVGILSAIVPLYQAEASPKWVRGSVVFTYQWAITWGLLIASSVCQGTRRIDSSASYRIPVGLQFLWAIILSIGMLFLPESPRYYVQKNDIEKALLSLTKLRRLPTNDPDLIEELVEIKANYDYELSFGKTTIWDCFRNGGGRHKQVLRMVTGIGVHAFQQCSGINFIFYYGVNFFASSGMKNYYLMSFTTYVVNMVFTIPGIILVDIIGRRSLLLWGGAGMCVSNILVAISGVAVSNDEASSILSISFSCVFIAFFASTWGGAVWAVASDIYGISIRQKAVALTAATNWLVNFIFAYITPYLIDTGTHTAALGNKIFFMWGGLNALGTVFVYFTVYETKGLKLEEVDFMYVNCSSATASNDFKSRKIDAVMYNDTYNNMVHNTNMMSSVVSRTHTTYGLSPSASNNDTNSLDGDSHFSHVNSSINAQESDKEKCVPKTNEKTTSTTETTATTGSSANFESPPYKKLISISPTSSKKALVPSDNIAMVPISAAVVPGFLSDSDSSQTDEDHEMGTTVQRNTDEVSKTNIAQQGETPEMDVELKNTDKENHFIAPTSIKTNLAKPGSSKKVAHSVRSTKSAHSVKSTHSEASAKSAISTASARSTSASIPEESTDYQVYLAALKREYPNSPAQPPPSLFNRGSLLLRKKNSRQRSEATDSEKQSGSDSEVSRSAPAKHIPPSLVNADLIGTSGSVMPIDPSTTIIATPFFNQPPSDSDSESD